MLAAIGLQMWLPDRHLYLYWEYIGTAEKHCFRIVRSGAKPAALVLPAGHDLLVPKPHFAELEEVCNMGEMAVQRVILQGVSAPRDPV